MLNYSHSWVQSINNKYHLVTETSFSIIDHLFAVTQKTDTVYSSIEDDP